MPEEMNELSPAEQLLHTTVRLECKRKDGTMATGTGFFFALQWGKEKQIPLIITNKHVIRDASVGTFVLTQAKDDGAPLTGQGVTIQIGDFEARWIQHPEKDVDLAAFVLAPLLNEAESRGVKIFYRTITDNYLPTQETIQEIGPIEDITMIGYPNGIWDQVHNMPIVRQGITATDPRLDYNGLPLFVIDCACFPGSSGSPILIFNQGGYTDSKGNTIVGRQRVILLGVLFAGPQHVASGEITTIDVPLQQVPISLSKIPNNLGFAVKSSKLRDFGRFFTD